MKRITFNINKRSDVESGIIKVITSYESEVQIIKWDAPSTEYPIVVMFKNGIVANYSVDGKCVDSRYCDILMLTDEPDYTPLEMTVFGILSNFNKHITEDDVKCSASKLLEAAKKEIESPTSEEDVISALKTLNLRILDISEKKPKSERTFWEQAWRLTNNAINSIVDKEVLNC